ncbi:MORN-repeat protein [Orpheovirus IHUMI-LCC2]|uniref:MORN-repeat protein n=1 Tax=Orpheovirus IHUMI-LCC2 TaxID=2023057 RepID=A0A2I2L560_9VIRU|nr:MORN-repeat protein [Orpheovirus IHUMI-LCC2]SNW62664.1 MORN-repeat protein [Orpheovirus IHUMI-LCC2]
MLLSLPKDIIHHHIININLYIAVSLSKTCKYLYNITKNINGITIKDYFLIPHEYQYVCGNEKFTFVGYIDKRLNNIGIRQNEGKVIEYFSDVRKIYKEYWYRDGKKHGPMKVDNANSLYEFKEYKYGKMHGIYQCFDHNIKIHEAEYKKGNLHGLLIKYHSNGVMKSYKNYKDGKFLL